MTKPSAIYVWLVPSEHMLDQPGSWRIRKWDTEPFPEANYCCGEAEQTVKDMEDMRVTLGCAVAIMLQTNDPRCREFARRIPIEIRNGEPYALVGTASYVEQPLSKENP